MVLKVDLKCCKCYKRVKKVLCKFPQIQDQVYDEKNDTVIIKVVCCSPEKIKQKIICKGGDCIKSIEIKVPQKPEISKPPEKTKEAEKSKESEKSKDPDKSKDSEKPKEADKCKESEKPKQSEKPKLVTPPRAPYPFPINLQYVGVSCQQCYIGYPGGPCFHGFGKPVKPEGQQDPKPTPPSPPAPGPIPSPGGLCCQECYDGYPGGPCFQGQGRPPQCYQYDGYGGRPVYDSYGGGRNHYVSRCNYLSEENPSGCTIM